ncbi:MAG: hypothetical protein ACT4P7_07535 [Gemmatimonadaceae bacterium]
MLERSRWTLGVRAGRSLDLTNDFRSVFDSGGVVSAVFTLDNYDYVERRLLALGVLRRLDRVQSVVRLETGPAVAACAHPHRPMGTAQPLARPGGRCPGCVE